MPNYVVIVRASLLYEVEASSSKEAERLAEQRLSEARRTASEEKVKIIDCVRVDPDRYSHLN